VHERIHRTLKQEATIPPGCSLRAQQRKFDRFREEFNEERPHEALGMKRPAQVYRCSIRAMPRWIEPYDYPSHYLVRRVSRDGTIRVLRNQVFVSNTLHEDNVGLEEVDDGVYDLFFCFYQIGRYELRVNKIHDIVSRVGVSRRQVDLASRVQPMSLEQSVTYVFGLYRPTAQQLAAALEQHQDTCPRVPPGRTPGRCAAQCRQTAHLPCRAVPGGTGSSTDPAGVRKVGDISRAELCENW
jgi:hypothetical protein